MMMKLQGRILVPATTTTCSRGDQQQQQDAATWFPILASNVSLSFWGGIDPVTGMIIDTFHPLAGHCVSHKILCLPTGRGSCTASQVLLELIVNDKAPAAVILRDVDPLVCVGAVVAQEILELDKCVVVPVVMCLGHEKYEQLLQAVAARHDNEESTSQAHTKVVGRVVESKDGHDACLYIGESSMQAIILQEEEEGLGGCVSEEEEEEDDDDDSATAVLQQQHLSIEEIQRLENASSDAERMALRVIYRYARLMNQQHPQSKKKKNTNPTTSYISISQAHIDGCTYIGPAGLQFVQTLVHAAGHVKIPTTLNSVSADRRQWKALGVPPEYAAKAMALGNAYLQLGCAPSFTCAPYLLLPGIIMNKNNNNKNRHGKQNVNNNEEKSNAASDIPTTYQGQNWAWGESNAVVFANSVLGARTEKTADYLDICEAIAGIVPKEGVYLDKNREPTILLDARDFMRRLEAKMTIGHSDKSYKNDVHSLFPVLGHLCGTLSDGRVPLLVGLENCSDWITLDHLKAFCAAFGTTGTSPLIHIAGITPEARNEEVIEKWISQCNGRVAEITSELLKETYNILDKDDGEKIDLIALGNPHLSVAECGDLLDLVQRSGERPQKHPDVRVVACLSRSVQAEAEKSGHIHPLREFGVEFVNDTCWCMLLDPPVIPARKDATILTNSGKYSHYGPGLTQRRFRFGSMADCVRTAMTGHFAKHPSTHPIWFPFNSSSRSYHAAAAAAAAAPVRSHGSSCRRLSATNTRALVLARTLLRKLQ